MQQPTITKTARTNDGGEDDDSKDDDGKDDDGKDNEDEDETARTGVESILFKSVRKQDLILHELAVKMRTLLLNTLTTILDPTLLLLNPTLLITLREHRIRATL